MAKGRFPDPTRARRHTGHRPLPAQWAPVGAPDTFTQVPPPESLPAGARPVWDAACAELLPRGLHPSDLPLVEMLAVAIYRHRQAGEYIAQMGSVLEDGDGLRANPALKVEKDTAVTYLRLAETLGLTPAARMRLGLMQVTGQSILVAIREEIEAIAEAEERRERRRKQAAR